MKDFDFRVLMTAVGFSLALPAWVGLFASGLPTIYSPFPALTIFPALVLSQWRLQSLAVFVPSVLFFLWNPGLVLSRHSFLPKRTVALVGILTALTIWDYFGEWKYGVEYHGPHFTILVYAINALWLSYIWWNVVRARRSPTLLNNVFTHWLLFAWLAWYAFPYLGELP